MNTLDKLEARIAHVKKLLWAIMNEPHNNDNRIHTAAKRVTFNQLQRKLQDLNTKYRELGTTITVVKISGKFNKVFGDGKIACKRSFTIYYSGVSPEDAVKILRKKYSFVDMETIQVRTLKPGELKLED